MLSLVVERETKPTRIFAEIAETCRLLSAYTPLPACLPASLPFRRHLTNEPMIDHLRHPDGTATQAVRIVATQGSSGGSSGNAGATPAATEDAAAAAPIGDEDPEAAGRGALAWIGLHARAATVAEEELAVEIAGRDAKVMLLIWFSFFLLCAVMLLVFYRESLVYISNQRGEIRPLVR